MSHPGRERTTFTARTIFKKWEILLYVLYIYWPRLCREERTGKLESPPPSPRTPPPPHWLCCSRKPVFSVANLLLPCQCRLSVGFSWDCASRSRAQRFRLKGQCRQNFVWTITKRNSRKWQVAKWFAIFSVHLRSCYFVVTWYCGSNSCSVYLRHPTQAIFRGHMCAARRTSRFPQFTVFPRGLERK